MAAGSKTQAVPEVVLLRDSVAIAPQLWESFRQIFTATHEMITPSLAKGEVIGRTFDRSAAVMEECPEDLMSLRLALRMRPMAKAAWPVRMRL